VATADYLEVLVWHVTEGTEESTRKFLNTLVSQVFENRVPRRKSGDKGEQVIEKKK
jgi:hypothetical protein